MPSTDEISRDIEALKTGDPEALSRLIDVARPLVMSVAGKIVKDTHLCDDILQEVSMRISRKISSLSDTRKFKPWVKRIAANLSLSLVRTRNRHPFIDPQNENASRSYSIEEDDGCSHIIDAIDDLPIKYGQAISLKHIDELTCREIEEKIGIPVSTMEIRLVRARAMLQKRLRVKFSRGRKRDPRTS